MIKENVSKEEEKANKMKISMLAIRGLIHQSRAKDRIKRV